MSTAEVKQLIGELARLGTRRLSLSGGEPMLRADLGEIVDHAVAAGVSVSLNTTGYLLPKRGASLRGLDLIKLSFDGRAEVFDAVRGRSGAFDELEAAIDAARRFEIPFSLVFTMTRKSLAEIGFALDFAGRHDAMIAFQPVMVASHSGTDTQALMPDPADYQAAIDTIVAAKRANPARIRNSLGGLAYVRRWPAYGGLDCWSGRVFAMVEPNGVVVPCDRISYASKPANWRDVGVEAALAQMPEPVCEGCGFCGSLELNMLMAGRPAALEPVVRLTR